MKPILFALMFMPAVAMSQTLEECQEAAARNYPLVRQYSLVEKTTQFTLSNIQKGWLPQISVSAQASVQSDVVSWPDEMRTMLNQMGLDIRGLKKDQYRIGIDVSQTLYDGSAIKQQREVAMQQGHVDKAQIDVGIYGLRKRVNELYFGLLLLDEKISLNRELQEVLRVNEETLGKMFRHGTASESDYHTIVAEHLAAKQVADELTSQRSMWKSVLQLLCGISVDTLVEPAPIETTIESRRPELKLYDEQLKLLDAQEKLLHANLLPRLNLFASGYYGYPGYNMFKDMVQHRMSLNGTIGLRLTWNIGAFYTRKNDRSKIDLQRDLTVSRRDLFEFDNRIEQAQGRANVDRYQRMLADDDEIVRLRGSIRKAAASKLAHGIIDIHDFVRDIYNENSASLNRSIHRIEMLKELYDLRYTLNN